MNCLEISFKLKSASGLKTTFLKLESLPQRCETSLPNLVAGHPKHREVNTVITVSHHFTSSAFQHSS